MVIDEVTDLPHGEARSFAWATLSHFQNTTLVAKILTDLHSIPLKHRHNAAKQADQIRYCLVQSREYFEAASSVSMSTKPVLLYYGIMSLALAEVLLKGSGDQSLDKARGQNAHHGLDLKISQDPSRLTPLSESASVLRAVPLVRGKGERFGTFELWHRVAREAPVSGKHTFSLDQGMSQETCSVLSKPTDERLPLLPEAGVSFLECATAHPRMKATLERNSLASAAVRFRVSARTTKATGQSNLQLFVQPGNEKAISTCIEYIKFDPKDVDRVVVQEFPSGYGIYWSDDEKDRVHMSIPNSFQENEDDPHFLGLSFLNEFGILYVGLFILGNYARYFPEQWMADVERDSPLALASQAFTEVVEERAALLTASELSRTGYIRG